MDFQGDISPKIDYRLQLEFASPKIVDIYHTLAEYTSNIVIYDPWADPVAVEGEYGVKLVDENFNALRGRFDAVILGVAHDQFRDMDVRSLLADPAAGVVYDVKGVLPRSIIDGRL